MKISCAFGSSPRSWGTQRRLPLANHRRRFIPTLVGNTRAAWPSRRSHPVHPHARGEHAQGKKVNAVLVGSSPRSWGTPRASAARTSVSRFIPTLVGNTAPKLNHRRTSAVHPHARGEHGQRESKTQSSGGSSPRSWGTLSKARNDLPDARFIPTLVGNTCRGQCRHCHRSGSSPRSWGTRAGCARPQPHRRFIPTLVGNTKRSATTARRWAVHPHARGEHPPVKLASATDVGSSPRSWGTLVPSARTEVVARFIPTLVGNTCSPLRAVPERPVHPHARGEHPARAVGVSGPAGSSPRSWGTRFRVDNW